MTNGDASPEKIAVLRSNTPEKMTVAIPNKYIDKATQDAPPKMALAIRAMNGS